MKKDTLYTIAGGAWIGGTMTVPGVSGGSMAMILGLYDRLIASVNGIFKDKQRRRESLLFLIKFLLGAVVGLFLFAKLITFLLENADALLFPWRRCRRRAADLSFRRREARFGFRFSLSHHRNRGGAAHRHDSERDI